MSDWIVFQYGGQLYKVPEHKASDTRVQKLLSKSKIISVFPIRLPQDEKIQRVEERLSAQIARKAQERKTSRPSILKPRRHIERHKLTGIEIMRLMELPKKFGIETDLFDVRSHIDSTLSYSENRNQIEEHLKQIGRAEEKVLSKEQFSADLEAHIDDLRFKVSGGDEQAQNELDFLMANKSKIGSV